MINWNKFGLQPQKKYGFVSHICNSEPAPSITIPNSNLLKEIIVFWYFFIDAWLFYLSLNILPNLNFSLWMTCLVKIATPSGPFLYLLPQHWPNISMFPYKETPLIKRPLSIWESQKEAPLIKRPFWPLVCLALTLTQYFLIHLYRDQWSLKYTEVQLQQMAFT